MKNESTARRLLRIPVLLLITLVYISPFYILATISFKNPADRSSYWHFPDVPTLENFKEAIAGAAHAHP